MAPYPPAKISFGKPCNISDMKQRVLVLGAGMVVQPLVDYLLERKIKVTLASRTVSKAKKALKDHPLGNAVSWTIDQQDQLNGNFQMGFVPPNMQMNMNGNLMNMNLNMRTSLRLILFIFRPC